MENRFDWFDFNFSVTNLYNWYHFLPPQISWNAYRTSYYIFFNVRYRYLMKTKTKVQCICVRFKINRLIYNLFKHSCLINKSSIKCNWIIRIRYGVLTYYSLYTHALSDHLIVTAINYFVIGFCSFFLTCINNLPKSISSHRLEHIQL